MINSAKNSKLRIVLFSLVFALILSFVLHDIIPHEHPAEIYGSGIQAIFHGSDRKWWHLLLVAFVWVVVDWAKRRRFDLGIEKCIAFIFSRFHIDVGKLFNPILQALRTGILNPRLYD